jgi:oligopeptide/dipeptide ABC transporter ATP-binding protein
VLDEPVSSLDVSVQAQILNLLGTLKASRGLTLLFISHDLDVVAWVADRVAVMYAGLLVEVGPSEAVLRSPRHPYTRALVAARGGAPTATFAEPPSPLAVPPGCAFHPRCPKAVEECRRTIPPLVGEGHQSACPVAKD